MFIIAEWNVNIWLSLSSIFLSKLLWSLFPCFCAIKKKLIEVFLKLYININAKNVCISKGIWYVYLVLAFFSGDSPGNRSFVTWVPINDDGVSSIGWWIYDIFLFWCGWRRCWLRRYIWQSRCNGSGRKLSLLDSPVFGFSCSDVITIEELICHQSSFNRPILSYLSVFFRA